MKAHEKRDYGDISKKTVHKMRNSGIYNWNSTNVEWLEMEATKPAWIVKKIQIFVIANSERDLMIRLVRWTWTLDENKLYKIVDYGIEGSRKYIFMR